MLFDPSRSAHTQHRHPIKIGMLALLGLMTWLCVTTIPATVAAQTVVIGGGQAAPSGATVIINQGVLDRLRARGGGTSPTTTAIGTAPAAPVTTTRVPFIPPIPERRPTSVARSVQVSPPPGRSPEPAPPAPTGVSGLPPTPAVVAAAPASSITEPAAVRDPRNPARPSIPERPALTIPPPPLPTTPTDPTTTAPPTASVPDTALPEVAELPPPPDIVTSRPPQPSDSALSPPTVAAASAPGSISASDVGATPDQVVSLEAGTGFRVLFEPTEAAITTDAGRLLEGIATRMIDNPALRLRMRAFAAIQPGQSAGDAQRLSLNRILAIRTLLSNRGVDTRRLDVLALGFRDDGSPPDRVDLQFVS